MTYTWKVLSSHDNGSSKVVEILVTVEGAEGPTEEVRELAWWGLEGYKVSPAGKVWPKTGTDYKREIGEWVDAVYNPKAISPCLSRQT